MNKKLKCIFASLLAVAMIISVVPVAAQADEPKKLTVSTVPKGTFSVMVRFGEVQ